MTQGLKIGQLALFFGANDMGSLMIEENVVASAGTVHYLTLEQIKNAIREAGYIPRQRNVFYQLIDREEENGTQNSQIGEPGGVSARSENETLPAMNSSSAASSSERIPVFLTPDS